MLVYVYGVELAWVAEMGDKTDMGGELRLVATFPDIASEVTIDLAAPSEQQAAAS